MSSQQYKKVERAVAALEAGKGVLSLTVGLGIHELGGQKIQQALELLTTHLHLNPASHFPGVFQHALADLNAVNITWIAIGALLYSIVRLVEAYGLWHSYVWTEWLALVSGAIYLPFEVYEVVVHKSTLSAFILFINVIVVWYMIYLLRSRKTERE